MVNRSEAIFTKIFNVECDNYRNQNSSECTAYFEWQEYNVLQIRQREIHDICHQAAKSNVIRQTLICNHVDTRKFRLILIP